MLTLKKIAVTGGLSSGKSTVCRLLQEQGAYVVDADQIVHQLLSSDSKIGQQVTQLLGPGVITHKQINRKKIAELVFSNSQKLKALEAILYPAVEKEIKHRYSSVQNDSRYLFFVAEVPLLYKTSLTPFFDTLIEVTAPEETAQERFIQKHQSTKEDFQRRREQQKGSSLKPDFILQNTGDLAALRQAVLKLVNTLKES